MSNVKLQFLSAILLLASATASGQDERVIRVYLPTGPGHALHVRGQGAGLSWDEGAARAMSEVPPGSGNWELRLSSRERAEFKILVDNRVWMSGGNRVIAPGESASLAVPEFDFPKGSVEAVQLKAPHGAQGTRTIRIYRPPGHDFAAREPYPLMLALDGQEFFDAGWSAGVTLDQAIGLGLRKPTVAVAIDNPGNHADRVWEMTTEGSVPHRFKGGGVGSLASWIKEVVLPYASAHARADTSPENVTAVGSSMAATAWVGIGARTGIAKNYHLPSGAYWWWTDEELEREVASLRARSPGAKFYVTVGRQESADPGIRREQIESSERLMRALEKTGAVRGRDFVHLEVPEGTHAARDWRPQLFSSLASPFWNGPVRDCLTEEFHRLMRFRQRFFE
ncbi:MAG TPA: alpha/beta hydrolase-fold protein [Bdellovibrionota bacterium]|nr:alpha/beta hydrolase-fold protein [Bdellovibrionota bacterium]